MGWIAKPGSPEDRLNRWLDRNILRVCLAVSAAVSIQWTVTIIEVARLDQRIIAIVPALFALGELIAAFKTRTIRELSTAQRGLVGLLLVPAVVDLVEGGVNALGLL